MPPSAPSRPSTTSHRARWLALLAAALLHLLFFATVTGHIAVPSWHTGNERVFIAELKSPPVASKPPPALLKPAPPHHARPKRKPAPAPTPVTASNALAAPEPAPATVPVGDAAPGTSVEPVAAAPSVATAETAETPKTASYKIDPPPSVELTYDVQALRQGQTWYGSGLYRWERNGDTYHATVEASIRLLVKITVLNTQSEGLIDERGIAPVLYSEKPFNKALTNTHFQHDAHKITFSASENSYPYLGGEQDRASIVWQLAGIGRADAAPFRPGAQFDIVVAGPRDAEPWHFDVVGEETLELDAGKLATWHVTRAPRPGSYDTRIDIWFAPQREWYPVRIRQTYANRDYLDMALSTIAPPAH